LIKIKKEKTSLKQQAVSEMGCEEGVCVYVCVCVCMYVCIHVCFRPLKTLTLLYLPVFINVFHVHLCFGHK
jgi:hypothetical protein